MKNKNLIPMIIVALAIMSLCFFAGCGDDVATAFVGATGPTGDTGLSGLPGTDGTDGVDGTTGPTGPGELVDLAVSITDQNQVPVEGALVTLTRVAVATPVTASQTAAGYLFTDITQGTYIINVTATGYIPYSEQVDVFEEEIASSAEIQLELQIELDLKMLYGITVDESGNQNLYMINPVTGLEDPETEVSIYEAGSIYEISCIDVHPITGVLYAIVHVDGTRGLTDAALLVTIDPETGTVNDLARLQIFKDVDIDSIPFLNEAQTAVDLSLFHGWIYSMSFRSDGSLYVHLYDYDREFEISNVNKLDESQNRDYPMRFAFLDISTGTLRELNREVAWPALWTGLAFSPADILYFITNVNENVYEINQASGDRTEVSLLSEYPGYITSMDFEPETGLLYGVVVYDEFAEKDLTGSQELPAETYASGGPAVLVIIDPLDGLTEVSPVSEEEAVVDDLTHIAWPKY